MSGVLAAAGKGASIAGDVAGIGADAASGGSSLQEMSGTSMTESEKAYQITGELVGIGVNVGLGVGSLASTIGGTFGAAVGFGPVGLAVAAVISVVQILGTIIDQFVNPFQPMFNRSLIDMRTAYHSNIKKSFLEMGLNWPLEIKPDLENFIFGEEKNINKYYDYLNEYYTNNNLITDEQYLEIYDLMLEARKIVRNKKAYVVDEKGDIIGSENINKAILEIESSSQSNRLLMLALLARIAKYKQENKPKPSMIKKFVETYYVGMIFWSILLCLLILLSIFFLFI